jgi:hypothetical protein
MKNWIRQFGISILLLSIFALTFASKGGGGEKKHDPTLRNDFTPIRTIHGLTLRATRPSFSGSFLFGEQRQDDRLSVHTMITYQRGNITYILPYHYRLSSLGLGSGSKSNLQLLDFRIKMPK